MGQNFLPDTVNQTLLFPPSLHDWLPDGHLARFLVDVVSGLDLEAIYASYREKDGRGQAAIKLHTLLDLRGAIPAFIHISNGRLHDVNVLDMLPVEAGSFYVMDRGYVDFKRL